MVAFRASAVEPRPVEWVWRRHIPVGMLTGTAGRPDQGKGLFASLVAADVSHEGVVVVSSAEDPHAEVTRPRLEAAGANLDNVILLENPISLPSGLSALSDLVFAERALLVILDPVAAHLEVSLSSDQDVRRVLTPLRSLAERSRCSILALAHLIKSVPRNAHPLQAVGGSGGGFAGACRVLYAFGRSPDDRDERVLAPLKCNVAQPPPSLRFELDVIGLDIELNGQVVEIEAPQLNLVGVTQVTADQLIIPQAPTLPRPEKLAKAAEFLVHYLRFGPRPKREIVEDARHRGITEMTLRRACQELGVEKPRGGRNSSWALPAELLEELNRDDEEADE